MSRGKERTLSDDWEALSRQLQKGKVQPKALPQELSLKKIKVWPGAFQHRGRRWADGERHVRDLAAAIKKSHTKTLDPGTIWLDGRAWACIDGHHRLDAYRAATGGVDHAIPVAVFEGSIEQAMGRAASANTKDKLVMSPAAKSNTAWRLVAATSMSKAETAEASGISESTVATMRRVHAQLTARVTPADDFELPQGADLRDYPGPRQRPLRLGMMRRVSTRTLPTRRRRRWPLPNESGVGRGRQPG